MKIIFIIIVFLFKINLAHSDEIVQIVPVDSNNVQDIDELQYQSLKNQTKINELYEEIDALKRQLQQMDVVQGELLSKLNSLLPQEGQLSAGDDSNISEF